MADVHQIVTLGIGTPSDIPHFILMGLTPEPNPSSALGLLATVTDGRRMIGRITERQRIGHVSERGQAGH